MEKNDNGQPVFEAITSQEQLDKIISGRLARKEQQVRAEVTSQLTEEFTEKYKDYDSLKERLSTLESSNKEMLGFKEKSEASAKELEALRNKVQKYETDSVKTKVAHESGLPYEAVSFLSGSTEEEIKASAEALKTIVGKRTLPLASGESGQVQDTHRSALRATLKGLKGE